MATILDPSSPTELATRAAEIPPSPAAQPGPKHGATVEFVYGKLREDILRRELGPGFRLIEGEITQRFGVSRGPVREALRRLAGEGLIEHVPNRGGTVSRHSPTELRELFLIRIELEALAARLAARSDDSIALAAFRQAVLPIFDDSRRQVSEYLLENTAFHHAVIKLAGNKALQDLVGRLQLTLIMSQVRDSLTQDVIATSMREHRTIANAILERAPDAAAAAMRAHLERAAALALSCR